MIHAHSYRDLELNVANNLVSTSQGSQQTVLQQGNATQHITGKYTINATQTVRLVNGQSQIKITPSNIFIDADKIVMGSGSGGAGGSATGGTGNDSSGTGNSGGVNPKAMAGALGAGATAASILAATAPSSDQKADSENTNTQDKKSRNETLTQEKYDYYLVTYEGDKMLLTQAMGETLAEIVVNFDLSDYFEEDRWVQPDRSFTSQSLTRGNVLRLGFVGVAMSASKIAFSQGLKNSLISALRQNIGKIQEMMPEQGGVLVEAIYQVAETDIGLNAELSAVHPLYSGAEYKPLIKKAMIEPFAIEVPINKRHHWEFLFIWVIKK
jgi:hypothetical protein